MPTVNLFGPVDRILGGELGIGEEVLLIEGLILGLVVLNLVTRHLAHRRHKRQADEGAAAVSRHPLHEVINVALVLATLYYTTLAHHAGVVMTMFVLGLFITDAFEFEARKVEARREIPLDRPNGAIVASSLVLLYAAYQVFFFAIKGGLATVV
ncbi:MAG: hypothetical protein V5A43_05475 [Haloarculaceae archaeon]